MSEVRFDFGKKIWIHRKMYTVTCPSHDNTWLIILILFLQLLFVILFIIFVIMPVMRVERMVDQATTEIGSTIREIKAAICGFLPTLPICQS